MGPPHVALVSRSASRVDGTQTAEIVVGTTLSACRCALMEFKSRALTILGLHELRSQGLEGLWLNGSKSCALRCQRVQVKAFLKTQGRSFLSAYFFSPSSFSSGRALRWAVILLASLVGRVRRKLCTRGSWRAGPRRRW